MFEIRRCFIDLNFEFVCIRASQTNDLLFNSRVHIFVCNMQLLCDVQVVEMLKTMLDFELIVKR